MKKIFNAFTLAEVMIVVLIIGVVAIIVLPVFIQDMQERINSNREANIAQKITKAMEVMTVNGDYDSFTTTEDFVQALKKYLKIMKICDNQHLTECWQSTTVTGSDGNKYNVSEATTGRKLHTNNDTNTMGLVLGDGAVLLLTYNPRFNPPSTESSFIPSKKNLPIGNNKKKEFAYTSNVTEGIDFVMDLNGGAGPNAESDDSGKYYDIRSFRIASFSSAGCPAEKVNGVCVYKLGTNFPSISCVDGKNAEYCDGDTTSAFSFYAGAKKTCADMGLKLTTLDELKSVHSLGILSLTNYIVNGTTGGCSNNGYNIPGKFHCQKDYCGPGSRCSAVCIGN